MAKDRFNPRYLMELAIEFMSKSVHEPRHDGKAGPMVGAVLYKADGTIDSACRGELRYGDHAEYTLLERKNRSNRLDGAKLFTTLEPCAPGSRSHPKLSCAERIVLARIKEVWVGIGDPDPKVDGKGIKYLQDNDVIVHMFDRDLQEIIAASNKNFMDQALERAADREIKQKRVVLSSLENAFTAVDADSFSDEALKLYKSISLIKDDLGSPEFNRRLIQQGIVKQENGVLLPTGFGILLFGKEPRTIIPQAGLLATIHYDDGKEELKDFEGPLVLIPSLIEKWLEDKLPNVTDRTSVYRKQIPVIPSEMVRESVINALIHRDYDIRQGKCQLIITVDTIVVKSPGGPPPPITLKQLQTFTAPMLSRNPELHYVFAKMSMAEERGLGIKSLKNRSQELGLPLPRYAWDDPYLVLTLFRNQDAASSALIPRIFESLNDAERKGWQWMARMGRANSNQYADAMKLDGRTARRHLKSFVELGLVRRIGSGPSTEYEVI